MTKAPPARLGARGVCLGHDTDSRVTQCGRPYLFALKSPAPWTVLAVIMAVNRQRAVAIWAGPGPQVLRGTIPRENNTGSAAAVGIVVVTHRLIAPRRQLPGLCLLLTRTRVGTSSYTPPTIGTPALRRMRSTTRPPMKAPNITCDSICQFASSFSSMDRTSFVASVDIGTVPFLKVLLAVFGG